VPGSSTYRIRYPWAATAFSASGVSGRREAAPGRAITATSLNTTMVSSTNTLSGQSSAGGTSIVLQPLSCSAAT
jgi:hypothetical protein